MNVPMEIRLPPHSVESEQALLGGLLIAGELAWDRVGDIVSETDFYRDDHRRIYRHIRRLVETGQTVDVLTVSTAIEQSNEVDQTGGLGYLGEIANATPSAANIAAYAKVVVEKSRMRALVMLADEIGSLALSSGTMTAQERLDEAEGRLMALIQSSASASDEPTPLNEILSGVVQDIEDRVARDCQVSGLPSGLADLDRMVDGFKPGDLIILAGRPSMGKSALALNFAEHAAVVEGKPAMVFSLEMSGRQLASRTLSSIGRINNKRMASGKLTDDDWDSMTSALGRLHAAPLIIDETPALSAAQIRSRARRQYRKHKNGLALIVIDYLQLMRGHGENRHQELSAITKALKEIAKTLHVPVICLSQLSRKVEDRGDKRPMLSDLRESGAIEEDADVVMMVYRDEYYHPDSTFKGVAEILVRKNRMGECGDVRAIFQPEFSRFCDADPAEIGRLNAEAAQLRKEKRGASRMRGMD